MTQYPHRWFSPENHGEGGSFGRPPFGGGAPHPIVLDYLPFGTTYVEQYLASLRFE
jgi:hypothetical protein